VVSWAQEARADAMAAEFEDLEDLDDTDGQRNNGSDADDFESLFGDSVDAGDRDAGGNGNAESDPYSDDETESDNKPDLTLKWTSLLDLTEDGGIKGTLHNVTLIVQHDPRTTGIIRYNSFAEKLVQYGNVGVKASKRKNAAKPTLQLSHTVWSQTDPINGDPWNDNRDAQLRRIIEAPKTQGGYGIKISDRDLSSAIDIVGSDNAFHPIREYLKGLTWDGVPRVEKLFIDYVKTPDNAYYREIARLTLIAGVTRVFEPGHKFDFAAILEGLQGRRKSTFIQVLGKHWSAELDGDFADDRAMIEKMLGAWLLEIPELSAFGKAEVNHIKAFMSRQEDRARLAYDRRVTIFRRQCIFMGSTNDKKYLKDETGGRRFWPVECTLGPDEEIDTERLEKNVDQLWAEAYLLYCQMRAEKPRGTLPLYIRNKDASRIAVSLQESRRLENATDNIKGVIKEWLDTPEHSGSIDDVKPKRFDRTCTMQIWVECFKGDMKNFPYQNQTSINKALRSLEGWIEDGQRRFPKYGRQKTYVRIESDT
jgi:predicted P-loop ATPase